jgi:hypothetical protein
VAFLRASSTGLPGVLDNLALGRFAGRIITRLPRVLTLAVDLGAETRADLDVDPPGAIDVTPADGCDAVQYRLVSVVLQHRGRTRALHFTGRRARGRWLFDVAQPQRCCQ